MRKNRGITTIPSFRKSYSSLDYYERHLNYEGKFAHFKVCEFLQKNLHVHLTPSVGSDFSQYCELKICNSKYLGFILYYEYACKNLRISICKTSVSTFDLNCLLN